MLQLILMTGLQGTGKSTIAKKLAQELTYPLFSKDRFETILYNDNLTDGTSISSYHMIMDTAALQLSLGISSILDAVFPLSGFRNRVKLIAEQHQAELKIIYTHCSDEHVHRQRLNSRESLVPWNRITWDDTLYTKSIYEVWSPDEALFLDAINPLETNIQKALQYTHDKI